MKTIHPIEEIAMNFSSLKVVTSNTFLVILMPWLPMKAARSWSCPPLCPSSCIQSQCWRNICELTVRIDDEAETPIV